jgi:hypothetical protein
MNTVTVTGNKLTGHSLNEALTTARQDMADPRTAKVALVRQADGRWTVITEAG